MYGEGRGGVGGGGGDISGVDSMFVTDPSLKINMSGSVVGGKFQTGVAVNGIRRHKRIKGSKQ